MINKALQFLFCVSFPVILVTPKILSRQGVIRAIWEGCMAHGSANIASRGIIAPLRGILVPVDK